MVRDGWNLSTHQRIEICNLDAMMLNIVDAQIPDEFSITRSIISVVSSKSTVFVWALEDDGIRRHFYQKVTIDHKCVTFFCNY